MPSIKIFKLITGDEVLAMYIKSGLFTITVEDPIYIQSMGTLVDAKVAMDKFSVYGTGLVKIKKSAILSTVEASVEIQDYFLRVREWMNSTYTDETLSELRAETQQLDEILAVDASARHNPEEIIKNLSPETKDRIYTHILENFEPPKGVPYN